MPHKTTIAEYNGVVPMHPMLQASVPLKQARGYKEPMLYPRVTGAIGSQLYTNIATDRARGACKWYWNPYMKPYYADPEIRLQFPYLQGKVVDVKQKPPKMYGDYSQRVSKNLVL